VFKGGETHLDLKDASPTPIPLPRVFAGWGCYVGVTERVGAAYMRQITCGGQWGAVDTYVSCDSTHRSAMSLLRLRQPIYGNKQEVDAAEKVSISVACGYDK